MPRILVLVSTDYKLYDFSCQGHTEILTAYKLCAAQFGGASCRKFNLSTLDGRISFTVRIFGIWKGVYRIFT
jgi:hypothetical protein